MIFNRAESKCPYFILVYRRYNKLSTLMHRAEPLELLSVPRAHNLPKAEDLAKLFHEESINHADPRLSSCLLIARIN